MLKIWNRALSTALTALVVVLTGCSDSAVAPSTADLGLTDDLLSPNPTVQVIERYWELQDDVSRTKTIGPEGGFIALPRTGFVVVFAPGAVSEPTEITVTAPEGDLVGYHFAPHGLEFNAPVTAIQSLIGTTGLGQVGALNAAYFTGELEAQVEALEILPIRSGRWGALAIFTIEHFSGYVIATG